MARVFAVLLLALSGSAAAQTGSPAARPARDGEPIEYRFQDDQMLGTTLSSSMAILRVNLHPGRVTLIRPRASFVGELLESVETL